MRYAPLIPAVLVLAVAASNSSGYDLDAQAKALKLIAEFAKEICGSIPLEGTAGAIDLSGKAKADLNSIIKKVADLGIEGAAKYQHSDYTGVLQADLTKALSESTDCKLKVWSDLKEKLLPPEPAPKEPDSPSVININGVWRDNWGALFHIWQDGKTFRFKAQGSAPCRGGYFESVGNGLISERTVESRYESNDVKGQCAGTVSVDGNQMTTTCFDSACGQFASFYVRQ